VLAEEVRSGLVETVHDGAVAVVSASGDLIASYGEIDRPFYFRSSAKPFQAAVSQACGAGLAREQIALACASHDGEPVHVALVESILASAGLTANDLRNPPGWPLAASAQRRLAAGGHTTPSRLWHNCSGKHAAMLAATVASGWDPSTYLDPHHPLQARITESISDLAGPVEPIGVDGCGAPVFATTARGMARAFARLSVAEEFLEIFDAMHAFPALVSGVDNVDAAIATQLDAVAKRGAAGAIGIGLRGRLGIAVKVWGGSGLIAGVAGLAALDQLGALTPFARERLQRHSHPVVKGGGQAVGRFEPRLELRWQ
jgi:L-asparaginase II